jgi:hypothetical protein
VNAVLEQTVYANYHSQGVMLLSVGFGATIQDIINFTINNNITIPVLSDFNTAVASLFLPYYGFYESSQLCMVDNDQIFQYRQVIFDVYNQIPDIVVALEGMLEPEISANATAIDFDTVTVNQTANFDLYIDNTGTGILGITSASVAGAPFSVDFTIGDIYALDDSMLIVVSFTPTLDGTFNDTLNIQNSVGDLVIPLIGVCYTNAVSDRSNGNPTRFELRGNYPNPFNASTSVQFSLPFASNVSIEVFNLEGIIVKSLNAGWLPAGNQIFNLDAGGLPSGLYFYRLNAGNFTANAKMVIIK